jgi:hypothetical protein
LTHVLQHVQHTEQLPALEHGAQLPGGEDGAEVPASEYEAARVLLRYLKDRVRDLDRDLPPAAQSEVRRCYPLTRLGQGCSTA